MRGDRAHGGRRGAICLDRAISTGVHRPLAHWCGDQHVAGSFEGGLLGEGGNSLLSDRLPHPVGCCGSDLVAILPIITDIILGAH